ncbi:MAG: hypothetical protein AABY80_07685, partial [Candidatus Deferrimicrobiota bacterium]
EAIRKCVKCDLELMANNNCLAGCALSPMHMNALSHAGQSWHGNKGFFIFKIAERDIPTPLMAARVKAYAERRYEGNLLDLVQPYGFKGVKESDRTNGRRFAWLLRFFFRPMLANPVRMLLLKRLADLLSMTRPVEGDPLVYIDNRALDGFMERFRERGCREDDCGECRWCHEFAGKSIRMDEGKRTRALAACDEIFRALHDGSMWRYLPGTKG